MRRDLGSQWSLKKSSCLLRMFRDGEASRNGRQRRTSGTCEAMEARKVFQEEKVVGGAMRR